MKYFYFWSVGSFVLHPKSWTQDWWCSFSMSKLTREDKIEIYERNENGVTIASLVKAFNVNKIVLHYLIRLIRKHGYDVLGNGKNRLCSKEFKLQTKGNLKL